MCNVKIRFSLQVYPGFARSWSNCRKSTFHRGSPTRFAKIKFGILPPSPQTRPTQNDKKKIYHSAALQTQSSSQTLKFFPLSHTSDKPLTSKRPSIFPSGLRCFQPNLSGRTSGRCLGAFWALNFLFSL